MKDPALIIHLTCASSPPYPLPATATLAAANFTAAGGAGAAAGATLPFLFRPGSEFEADAFRWEQRLFTVVLDIAGVAIGTAQLPHRQLELAPLQRGVRGGEEDGGGGGQLLRILQALSLHAGGRLLRARSLKQLLKCAETLCSKAQAAVARSVRVNFQPSGSERNPAAPFRARLLVKAKSGASRRPPAHRPPLTIFLLFLLSLSECSPVF